MTTRMRRIDASMARTSESPCYHTPPNLTQDLFALTNFFWTRGSASDLRVHFSHSDRTQDEPVPPKYTSPNMVHTAHERPTQRSRAPIRHHVCWKNSGRA